MTPEEAIEMLTGKREVKNARCNGKNKTMDELRQVVIEALEKQIPKKINYIAIPHCSCGCVIGRTDNYCRTCGQAVKRGD